MTQNLEIIKTYYMENESVNIHCLAAAFPLPIITWTFQSIDDSMIETLTVSKLAMII